MTFPVEEIADGDSLFRRVRDNRFSASGKPMPGAFAENGAGMSTDWSKYSTAASSLAASPEPARFGIVQLAVGAIRETGAVVAHTPRHHNRAHSDVSMVSEEIRLKLARMAVVIGDPPPPRKRNTTKS